MKAKTVEIFIGVRGEEFEAATTLKVLCLAMGVSYSTAKWERGQESSEWAVGVWLREKGERGGDPGKTWLVKRVKLRKIEGRGRSRDNSKYLVPRGSNGNPW